MNRSRCCLDVDLGGPKELCIRWGPDPPREGALRGGKGAAHFIVYGPFAMICAKTAEMTDIQFRMLSRERPGNHILDGMQMPTQEGHLWGVWPTEKHCKA